MKMCLLIIFIPEICVLCHSDMTIETYNTLTYTETFVNVVILYLLLEDDNA